jgi:hypothetical protein
MTAAKTFREGMYELIGTALVTYGFFMSNKNDVEPLTFGFSIVQSNLFTLTLVALWIVWENGPAQFNMAIGFAEIFVTGTKGIVPFIVFSIFQLAGSLLGVLLTWMVAI